MIRFCFSALFCAISHTNTKFYIIIIDVIARSTMSENPGKFSDNCLVERLCKFSQKVNLAEQKNFDFKTVFKLLNFIMLESFSSCIKMCLNMAVFNFNSNLRVNRKIKSLNLNNFLLVFLWIRQISNIYSTFRLTKDEHYMTGWEAHFMSNGSIQTTLWHKK